VSDVRALAPEWIRSLEPYPPGLPIEEVERKHGIRGSIKLASNENPLGPSPRALEAIARGLSSLHRYPDGATFYLRRRLAERHGVPPDEILVGNGSNEIIELVVRAVMREGDDAVISDQAFLIYALVVQAVGGHPVQVPLRDFTHDLDGMSRAVTARTRVVFVANPNNPTGTIVRRDAWRRFLQTLHGRSLVVVADEAYAEYVRDPAYPDTVHERGDGTVPVVTLRTFSKLFGLAGLRVGYAVAPPPVIDLLARVRQPFNVNGLAQVGALAALDDTEHVERTLATNREGMAYLEDALTRLGIAFVPSQANFLLVHVGRGLAVYDALLRRGVITRPMDAYGFPAHLRVTVGLAEENLRFVEALAAVLRAT
jgi:histidinol-phosphate aminotransferase